MELQHLSIWISLNFPNGGGKHERTNERTNQPSVPHHLPNYVITYWLAYLLTGKELSDQWCKTYREACRQIFRLCSLPYIQEPTFDV
jgi:hypothetical protein